MSALKTALHSAMGQAVETCLGHVENGGLPFVGVIVDQGGKVISEFGVNRVAETGDPTAHAEVVAMRDAMTTYDLDALTGTVLLATGEPCGLCYRYAINHGIDAIYVAVDRDEVADLGFDYRASYRTFGITDADRAKLFRHLPVARGIDPFTHFLHLHLSDHAVAWLGTESKGTPS